MRIVVCLTLTVIACVLAGCGGSGDGHLSNGAGGGSDSSRPTAIKGLGRIRPEGGIINVGGAVGDRLIALHVERDDEVKKGQELGRLLSYTLRQHEIDQLNEQIAVMEASGKAELGVAEANLKAARLAVELAEKESVEIAAQEKQIAFLTAKLKYDEERLERLDDPAISLARREEQTLLVEQTTSQLEAARAKREQLKQARESRQQTARAEHEAAQALKEKVAPTFSTKTLAAQRDLATFQRDQAKIVAPRDGRVLEVHVHEGELIGPTPMLEMADLSKMICVAEIDETDVGHVREALRALKGEGRLAATIASQAIGELKGHVTWVGRMVDSPTSQAVNPLERRSDLRVVDVYIAVDDITVDGIRQIDVASRAINFEATVTIHLDGKSD